MNTLLKVLGLMQSSRLWLPVCTFVFGLMGFNLELPQDIVRSLSSSNFNGNGTQVIVQGSGLDLPERQNIHLLIGSADQPQKRLICQPMTTQEPPNLLDSSGLVQDLTSKKKTLDTIIRWDDL